MKDSFAVPVKVDDEFRIQLPDEAKAMFDIKAGEEMILLGDKNQGIALMTPDLANKKMGPISASILNHARDLQ